MALDKLADSVTILKSLGKTIPHPTDEDLDKFEKAHTFALPKDYREFVKTFGPGELGRYFRIYSPKHGKRLSRLDLTEYLKSFHDTRAVLAKFINEKELIMRLIPFSNTIGGDVIAWDPENRATGSSCDYRIYVITRDTSRIISLADTFEFFIEKVCLGTVFAKKLKLQNWHVFREFIPYGSR